MTHPKIVGLSDKAFRLWVWGLAYCQQHLTDGVIPLAAATVQAARVAHDLVDARLWERLEPSGWLVHHYCDWNDSRETVEEKKARARERMKNVRGRTSHEVPVRLGSVPPSGSDLQEKKNEEKDDPLQGRFNLFWATYPRKIGKGDAWNAWRKLRPDNDLTAKIIQSIQAHQGDLQWQKDSGQFIPHPSRFLNDRRFEDELTSQPHVSEATSRLAQAVRDFSGSS